MKRLQLCLSGFLAAAFVVAASPAGAKTQTDVLSKAAAKGIHSHDATVVARKSGGKVRLKDISITKKLDKASPVLKQAPSDGPLKGGLLENGPATLSTQGPSATGAPSAPAGVPRGPLR
jgi:hypothetical protein